MASIYQDVISDSNDDLPHSPFNLTSENPAEICEGDIVWTKHKKLYWPALVRRVHKKEKKLTFWFTDTPGNTFKVPISRVYPFRDEQKTNQFAEEAVNLGCAEKHIELVTNASLYLKLKSAGCKVDPIYFFYPGHSFFKPKEEDDRSKMLRCITSGKADMHLQDIGDEKIKSFYHDLYINTKKKDKHILENISYGPVRDLNILRKISSYLTGLCDRLWSDKCEKTQKHINYEYIKYVLLPESVIFAMSYIRGVSLSVACKVFHLYSIYFKPNYRDLYSACTVSKIASTKKIFEVKHNKAKSASQNNVKQDQDEPNLSPKKTKHVSDDMHKRKYAKNSDSENSHSTFSSQKKTKSLVKDLVKSRKDCKAESFSENVAQDEEELNLSEKTQRASNVKKIIKRVTKCPDRSRKCAKALNLCEDTSEDKDENICENMTQDEDKLNAPSPKRRLVVILKDINSDRPSPPKDQKIDEV